MTAPPKRKRPAGRTFYTTVLALSILAALSSFNNRREDVQSSDQLTGRSLVRRDEEVRFQKYLGPVKLLIFASVALFTNFPTNVPSFSRIAPMKKLACFPTCNSTIVPSFMLSLSLLSYS